MAPATGLLWVIASAGALSAPKILGPFASTRVEAIRTLPDWFRQLGGDDGAVAIEDTPIGWGLVARRAIAPGERIVMVPRALCIAASDGPQWLRETSNLPDAPGVDAGTAIAARVLDEFALGASSRWAAYLAAVPRAADLAVVPTLWPEADAARLLAGTQAGASRANLLAGWRDELVALNARRALAGLAPHGWAEFLLARTLVMTRSYNLPGVGYAVMPFICFVNHDDERFNNLDPLFDETAGDDAACAVALTARRAIAAGEQVFSTYCAGADDGLDALKALQAFGWMPTRDAGAPRAHGVTARAAVASCDVDCAGALRRDDPLAREKLELMEAGAPGGGRVTLSLRDADFVARPPTPSDDVAAAATACAGAAALVALRLAEMGEAELAATIEGAEASPWFHGAPLSARNEAAARRAGADLLRRELAVLDKDASDRAAAVREVRERAASDADGLMSEMSEANADGQRRATVALLDWFNDAT